MNQTLLGAMLAGTAALARLALRIRRLGGLARVTRTQTTTTETRNRSGGLLRCGCKGGKSGWGSLIWELVRVST